MSFEDVPRCPHRTFRYFIFLGVLWGNLGTLFAQERPDLADTQTGRVSPVFLGVSSCDAIGCHRAPGETGVKGNEYSLWLKDPHARGVAVLSNPLSRDMARILGIPKPDRDARCLSCHAGVVPDHNAVGPHFQWSDGVGCEACHGAAEAWLGPHTEHSWRRLGWEGDAATRKMSLGMTHTKDLTVRAEVCVKCHVGDTQRDVTHDLIAAGHPRLTFEFSSHLARLPRHWRLRASSNEAQPRDKDRYPDFEARAWEIGQLVTEKAALELLAHRTRKESPTWPELAEFDCHSCHHSLQSQGAWKEYPRVSQGLKWGDWSNTHFSGALPISSTESLSELRKTLSSPRALSDLGLQSRIHELARHRARELSGSLPHPGTTALSVDELQTRLRRMADRPPSEYFSWDAAAQHVLALKAHLAALQDLSGSPLDPVVSTSLERMTGLLRYRPATNSPADFSPRTFHGELQQLRNRVSE